MTSPLESLASAPITKEPLMFAKPYMMIRSSFSGPMTTVLGQAWTNSLRTLRRYGEASLLLLLIRGCAGANWPASSTSSQLVPMNGAPNSFGRGRGASSQARGIKHIPPSPKNSPISTQDAHSTPRSPRNPGHKTLSRPTRHVGGPRNLAGSRGPSCKVYSGAAMSSRNNGSKCLDYFMLSSTPASPRHKE